METYINNNIPFLTDGGLETELIFHHEIDLPHFAAFPLLEDPNYLDIIKNYYKRYLDIAIESKTGFILESPTWRANENWGYKLGYDREDLNRVNTVAMDLMDELKVEYKDQIPHVLISGCIGPQGDGYQFEQATSVDDAKQYHNDQVSICKKGNADFVTGLTMTSINEACGLVLSAMDNNISVVISFTVELDGNLPSGESIEDAILTIDGLTKNYPLYYMINCAHPVHFIKKIKDDNLWKGRIHGIRSNASCKSHAELDESTELDSGNLIELGNWYKQLQDALPNLHVYGGCCGTDVSHIKSIWESISQSKLLSN